MCFPEGWRSWNESQRLQKAWILGHPAHTHHLTRKTRKGKTRGGGEKILGADGEDLNWLLLTISLSLSRFFLLLLLLPTSPFLEGEGAMLTFGPWGALSSPPATHWTLKQPARKQISHSSIFHDVFVTPQTFSNTFASWSLNKFTVSFTVDLCIHFSTNEDNEAFFRGFFGHRFFEAVAP